MCIAEDRATAEAPLSSLVASLAHQRPDLKAILFCPNATEVFSEGFTKYPNCSLDPCAINGAWTKYDIKPLALIAAFGTGAQDVLWIDSEILVSRDFRAVLANLSEETLAVTEEALSNGKADRDGPHAGLWGMPVGRSLPFAANTGVIRVTAAHLELLHAWPDLLRNPVYRAAQAAP